MDPLGVAKLDNFCIFVFNKNYFTLSTSITTSECGLCFVRSAHLHLSRARARLIREDRDDTGPLPASHMCPSGGGQTELIQRDAFV